MKNINVRKLVMCALLMAICFVVTRFLSVPAFYTKGYVNLGDLVVLVSAYVLSGWYGAAAAGFGAALADASMGFYVYVPATFVIKGLMVFVAALFFKLSKRNNTGPYTYIHIIIGAVLAEVIMTIGYFVYEILLYKSVVVALASVAGNVIQGVTCVVPSVIILIIFKNNITVSKMISSFK